MNQTNNGGPAFPHTIIGDLGQTREVCEGMMLRDYFATKALPALIAAGVSTDYVSAEAFKIADAMLAERAK